MRRDLGDEVFDVVGQALWGQASRTALQRVASARWPRLARSYGSSKLCRLSEARSESSRFRPAKFSKPQRFCGRLRGDAAVRFLLGQARDNAERRALLSLLAAQVDLESRALQLAEGQRAAGAVAGTVEVMRGGGL